MIECGRHHCTMLAVQLRPSSSGIYLDVCRAAMGWWTRRRRGLQARNEQRERQREQREKRRAAEARARRYPMDDELLRDELIEEAIEQGARRPEHEGFA